MVLPEWAVWLLWFVAFVASVGWVTLVNKRWTYADEPLWARAGYLAILIVCFVAVTLWWKP